jgi:hypothetical protein
MLGNFFPSWPWIVIVLLQQQLEGADKGIASGRITKVNHDKNYVIGSTIYFHFSDLTKISPSQYIIKEQSILGIDKD